MARATESEQSFGVVGGVLVLAGALLALVSFRFLDWYDVSPDAADSAGSVTFARLHTGADQLKDAAIATAYFDWLAWALLLALIVVGVAANLPTALADPLRVAGFVVGLLGVASTYYAVAQYFDATGTDHNVLHNASWGVWAALTGFLVGAVGAGFGPRRSR